MKEKNSGKYLEESAMLENNYFLYIKATSQLKSNTQSQNKRQNFKWNKKESNQKKLALK